MPITDFLEKNARNWPGDVALVEVNPAMEPAKPITFSMLGISTIR